MGMQHIGPPCPRQFDDGIGQQAHFTPFAQACRALGLAARAMEGQPLGLFGIGPVQCMTQAGDAAHLQPQRLCAVRIARVRKV
jgi:hypothetical protein